jgi:hypothetical protein
MPVARRSRFHGIHWVKARAPERGEAYMIPILGITV